MLLRPVRVMRESCGVLQTLHAVKDIYKGARRGIRVWHQEHRPR